MRRSRPRPARLGVLGLVVALATTLLPPMAAPAAAAGRPVHVFGDSVLLGAKTAIEQRLSTKGWAPQVMAAVGVSVPTTTRLVNSMRPQLGDVVVLGVGNNYFGNPVVFRREIDELMTALSGVRRVIWLNLREFRPDRRAANDELAAATGRWPNLEIADWNNLSLSRPNVFWSDGLHLRPEGAALMAELVDSRLDAYLAGRPPSRTPVLGASFEPLRPNVYGFGEASGDSGPGGLVSRHAFVGVAGTPSGKGYWLATADGGVFTAGDAHFYGSTGAVRLNRPIVGIAATPSGRGYWLVASDGGVFTFGDARFYGSTGAIPLNQPVVGIAATPSGRGYWLVASDGGVFTFGDARFYGSTGAMRLNRPIVALAPRPDGLGYWLLAYDGGIFTFGSARFYGSTGDRDLFWPVVSMAVAPKGEGYWLLGANGAVYRFGYAEEYGSREDRDIADLFVAMAPHPTGGYWLVAQRRA